MRTYLPRKGETDDSAAALDEAPTNPDQSEADDLQQIESEEESSTEDSEDNPPDMNTSGSRDVPATATEHNKSSPSDKLKARIAQTENPVLRSKLLKIQKMHDEINLLSDPKELTKKYLAKSPADIMEDNSAGDDDDEETSQSDGSDGSADNGKYHLRNLSTKRMSPYTTRMQARNPTQSRFSTRPRPLLGARSYETRTRREATSTA